MTTIQTIAATTECNDVIPEQMNTELTILSGKFAGTCYAKEPDDSYPAGGTCGKESRRHGGTRTSFGIPALHGDNGNPMSENHCHVVEFYRCIQYIRKKRKIHQNAAADRKRTGVL